MKSFPARSLMAAAVAAALAACGGPSDAPVAQQKGVFLDAAVEGLEYSVGTRTGTTSASGEFTCDVGEAISFRLGGVSLGSAACASVITPLTLAGGTDVKDAKVVNRLLMLQLLDEDNDPANGIRIGADVRAALAGKSLDFSQAATAFNTSVTSSLAALGATLGTNHGARSVDEDRRLLVREHFEDKMASKANAPVRENITQTTPLGLVAATVTRYQVQATAAQHIPYEGAVAGVKADFPHGFLPSYGSGLAYKGVNANGELEFYGLTDRGPNGDGPNVPAVSGTGSTGSKIFPAPSFVPSIGIITLGKNGAVLGAVTPLKAAAGVNLSGLPLAAGALGYSAEVPVFDQMKYEPAGKAVFNTNGLDSEAIAVDKKRNALWLADEYGPFLVRVDAASGVVQARYAPGSGLPAILQKRRPNRGMEGMAFDAAADKIHGFLQSPLSDGNAAYSVTGKSERVERFARFTRWIEFDPVTGATTRMFAYPLTGSDWLDGRTGNAKLGDMVALGNGKFIVIEQGAAPNGKVANKLMLLEIGNATDISAAAFNPASSDLEKSSMAGSAVNGASWAGVVPLKKTLLLDLNAIGWLAEKAEGLTLVDGSTLALANDNDFGLRTLVLDANGKAVADADVTACNVDASGVIVAGNGAGCHPANAIRVARGLDRERPSRLWLIKFAKDLSNY